MNASRQSFTFGELLELRNAVTHEIRAPDEELSLSGDSSTYDYSAQIAVVQRLEAKLTGYIGDSKDLGYTTAATTTKEQ